MWKCSQVFSLQDTYLWNRLSVRHWAPEALFYEIFDFRDQKNTGMCQKVNYAWGLGEYTTYNRKAYVLTVSNNKKSQCKKHAMTPKNGLESRSPSSKIQIFYSFAHSDHVIYIFWNFRLDNRNHRPKLPYRTKFGTDWVSQRKIQNFGFENQSNLGSNFSNFLKLHKIC